MDGLRGLDEERVGPLVADGRRRRSYRPAATALLAGAATLICLAGVLLPLLAVARGVGALLGSGFTGQSWPGSAAALVALLVGSLFFAYSARYYLAAVLVIGAGLLDPRRRGRTARDVETASGLRRIPARGLDGAAIGLEVTPFVSVHIACYNEKRVIARLLEACAAFDYPSYEVIVCDDSTDETAEIVAGYAGRPGFKVFHRDTRAGYKGAALRQALAGMDPRTELVMVLDADALPFPDAIQCFVRNFYVRDASGRPRLRERLAAVQSYQWHVLNKGLSWLTEAVRVEYSGSYMVERPAQEVLGSLKMIAGTAYMIRADVLREMGWGESLTEDWELTLRLYAAGWKVAYTPYAEVPAECVSTFPRLARQRMRWAEGHSFNVRRHFWRILGSPHLGAMEKLEFLYYAAYYLQAVMLALGTASWVMAELVLHAHVPLWTAALGWSLLFSNVLALPVMNLSGLLLEGAPRRDLRGVLGAVALSFLLVPFQAWAAVKGLVEAQEGTWSRTEKTGVVTTEGVVDVTSDPRPAAPVVGGRSPVFDRLAAALRRARPLGGALPRGAVAWALTAVVVAATGALLAAAFGSPGASASPGPGAPAELYLRSTAGGAQGDALLDGFPTDTAPHTLPFPDANGAIWATTATYGDGTIGLAATSNIWTFTFWRDASTCEQGGCSITVHTGYYSRCGSAGCLLRTPLFTFLPAPVDSGSGVETLTATEPQMQLSGCPCALYLTVTAKAGHGQRFALDYDAATEPSGLGLPVIQVPERLWPVGLVAPAIPLLARRRRSRLKPAAADR